MALARFERVCVPSEDGLLVGTKPGHLLLYRIKKDAGRSDARL